MCIHHPSGDVKKICFDDDSPTSNLPEEPQFGTSANGNLGDRTRIVGLSPFDQNHRVIGQLYGGIAACNGSVNNGEPDWYGGLMSVGDWGCPTTSTLRLGH